MSMMLPEMPPGFGGGMMGPPPPPPAPEPQADVGSEISRIRAEVLALAEQDGSVTEQERLIVEQITTLLTKLTAGREKEDDALLGGPASQAIRRAYQG